MAPETLAGPKTVPTDDNIVALSLQLEELRSEKTLDKGKYPEGQPTDATRALLEYQSELAGCLQTLTDLKLAHSIAYAVETDGPVIASLMSIEVQAEEDRKTALQISTDDPDLESPVSPPSYEEIEPAKSFMNQQMQQLNGLPWDTSRVFSDDCSTQASVDKDDEEPLSLKSSQACTYTKRQQAALEALRSHDIACCACSEQFRPGDVFRLECNDVFCRTCLKKVIQLAMQDKSNFPPRCHRLALSRDIISSLLSQQELVDFHNTEIEVSCTVKTYCSNASCGRFIPPAQIVADRAHCTLCGSSTCTNCNNEYHDDDCPEDPLLQATLALATEQKWQRCFSCRAVVILAKACNHITLVLPRIVTPGRLSSSLISD